MSGLVLKSPAEMAVMDEANAIIRGVLRALRTRLRPGMTTAEVDSFAEEAIRKAGGVPAFKGYPHRGDGKDFPGTVCISINDEIVHGIPSRKRSIEEGDLVSVDVGILYKGFYGDAAETYGVGRISPEAETLLRVTREALAKAVEAARPGNRISDIGHAVQTHVELHGFSVVREFVGHGIGTRLHEEPQVPNFGPPGQGQRLVPGMVLAVEPMVNAGRAEVRLDSEDGWTARTRDGSLSAHFEVSVAVTERGPWVLGGPLDVEDQPALREKASRGA